jgi:ABC-type nitrate/sulfonate/bicarbonate transport system substrate-binding protein
MIEKYPLYYKSNVISFQISHYIKTPTAYTNFTMKNKTKLLVILGLLIFYYAANTFALEKVTLQLRWDHQFQFAGYYAADWQGYYKEEGIEVEIKSAVQTDGKILSAVKEVKSGKADFGNPLVRIHF